VATSVATSTHGDVEAVIDPNGHAAYTAFATMMSEAWRVAEGNVYGRNLKR
jgi:hypothetical protein